MGRWEGREAGLCAGRRKTHAQGPRPGPGTCHLLESPSCIAPALTSLKRRPPLLRPSASLQVGRTWTTAAVSSCRTPHILAREVPLPLLLLPEKKQVGLEPRASLLPSPPSPGHPDSCSASFGHACRASLKIGPQQIFTERKMGWLVQLLPSSKVFL